VQLGARVPQIGESLSPCLALTSSHSHASVLSAAAKNFTTRCEGLSPALFFFAIFGNLTYVFSICAKSMEKKYLVTNSSWIAGKRQLSKVRDGNVLIEARVGSGLTVFLDLIVSGKSMDATRHGLTGNLLILIRCWGNFAITEVWIGVGKAADPGRMEERMEIHCRVVNRSMQRVCVAWVAIDTMMQNNHRLGMRLPGMGSAKCSQGRETRDVPFPGASFRDSWFCRTQQRRARCRSPISRSASCRSGSSSLSLCITICLYNHDDSSTGPLSPPARSPGCLSPFSSAGLSSKP
jgi:hypothetical protein